MSSFLLLFPLSFGQYVFRFSSGVCRTREPTQNFELRPLLNPRESFVLIPLTITGYWWDGAILIKTYEFCFLWIQVETNAYCLLQSMQPKFSFSRCICFEACGHLRILHQ